MPVVADASVAIRGDLTPFKKDLQGADKQAQSLGERMKGLLSPKNLLLGAAGGLAGAEVFQFLGNAVNDASNLEQATGAVESILGDASGTLREFGETSAESFGLSKRSVNELGAVLGAQLQGMGYEADNAATTIVDLQKRGADLAATFGGTTAEAVQAMSSLLKGERDPIERYGVSLKEADIQARIMALGLDTSTTSAQKQATAIASLDLLMEQTAKSAGQAARESDTFAGSQARSAAKMEDASAALGKQLLPILAELTDFAADVAVPAMTILAEAIGSIVGPISKGVGNIGNAFKEAGGDVHYFAMNFGDEGDRVHKIADKYGITFDDLKDRIRDRMLETGESFDEAATYVEDRARETAVKLPKTMDEGMRATHQVVRDVGAEIKAEWEGVAETIPQAVRDRWDDTRRAAFQTAVEHARGILDGQNQIKVALEVLTQLQEEEQTRAQRISYLQGLLNSQELRDGLNDGREGVRGAASALRSQIVAELASLGVNAYNSGYSVGSELARGMYNSAHLADGASSYLAAKISGYLPRSEPKTGPLRGITKVGDAIVSSITDGIYDNLGTAGHAAAALAGALAPTGLGSLGTAAISGSVGGAEVHYHLEVNGREKLVGTRDEVLDAWMQMSTFGGDGRLR